MYLSKNAKSIGINCQIYLSKLSNVFVQIAKCICPNCQMYLSKNCLVITLCLLSLCLAPPSPLALSAQVVFCQRKSYRSEVISSERQKRKYIFYGEKEIRGLSRGEIQNKRRQTCLGQMSPKFVSDVTF